MHDPDPTTFEAWAADPSNATRERLVWRLPAYRMAAYAQHTGWADAVSLLAHPVTERTSGQLYRALGSVASNLAEGYSRSSGRDRVRLYEYALGSARESIAWYRGAVPVLGRALVERREAHLHRLVSLLLIVIPRERSRSAAKVT